MCTEMAATALQKVRITHLVLFILIIICAQVCWFPLHINLLQNCKRWIQCPLYLLPYDSVLRMTSFAIVPLRMRVQDCDQFTLEFDIDRVCICLSIWVWTATPKKSDLSAKACSVNVCVNIAVTPPFLPHNFVLQVHMGDGQRTTDLLWHESVSTRPPDLLYLGHAATQTRGYWLVSSSSVYNAVQHVNLVTCMKSVHLITVCVCEKQWCRRPGERGILRLVSELRTRLLSSIMSE